MTSFKIMTHKNPIVVQKYGGSSVATTQRIKEVALLIKQRRDQGFRLCVVVSAMGKNTDQLLALAKEICANPSRRELDMLLSCGERASMALLAMALQDIGVESISFTGSQSGIITDDVHSGARIIEVRPSRVLEALERDSVVIVAGFQGVSFKREITTLGRGGSDTTAVALAAALHAQACEIYSDVAGIYSADPRLVPSALRLEGISFEEMEELSFAGAKVLNAQAVQFAKRSGIVIHARKTGDTEGETLIGVATPSAPKKLSALAHQERVHCIQIGRLSDLAEVLERFAHAGVPIAHVWAPPQAQGALCLVPHEDAHGLELLLESLTGRAVQQSDCSTLSLIGAGLGQSPQILASALATLGKAKLGVQGLVGSSLRATLVLEPNSLEQALVLLHERLIERPSA
jgi:aspartate kinase